MHHTGKEVIRPDGSKAAPNPRGASVIQDVVDVSAFLEKTSTKDVTRMTFPKTRAVKSMGVEEILLKYDDDTYLLSPWEGDQTKQKDRIEVASLIAELKQGGCIASRIAQECGVNRGTVSRWSTGKMLPDPEHLAKLRAILGGSGEGVTVTTSRKDCLPALFLENQTRQDSLSSQESPQDATIAEDATQHHATVRELHATIPNPKSDSLLAHPELLYILDTNITPHHSPLPSLGESPKAHQPLPDNLKGLGLCAKCPLKDAEFIPGQGSQDSSIMLLDDIPREDDVKEADLLGQLFGVSKQNLTSLYMTHVVKCVLLKDKKLPTKKMQQCCRPILDAELKAIQPREVITLGAIPFNVFKEGRYLLGASRKPTMVGLPVIQILLMQCRRKHSGWFARSGTSQLPMGFLNTATLHNTILPE